MKYNIGKYKDRDKYISDCIDIVDGITQNISQIISISSIEHLKNDEEILKISVLSDFLMLLNKTPPFPDLILSILVDTFSSRILNPMLLPSGKRNIVVF